MPSSETVNKNNKRGTLREQEEFLRKCGFHFDIQANPFQQWDPEVNILVLYKGEFFDAEVGVRKISEKEEKMTRIFNNCYNYLQTWLGS